jgi:hypothetical protein
MPARCDRHNGPSKDDAASIDLARHRGKSEKAMAEQRVVASEARDVRSPLVSGRSERRSRMSA